MSFNFARQNKLKKLATQEFDKIVLGIDPGTSMTGYGLVGVKGKSFISISMGIIELRKLDDHSEKLKRIYERVDALIKSYAPSEMAVEAPFYGKNVQSMLKLGRAQGVAIAAALNHNIPIFEYSPKKIKQTITGNGNASKEQVAGMLKTLTGIEVTPKFLDATDALGTAICHCMQFSPRAFGKIGSEKISWEKFLGDNPGRIK